MFRNAKSIDFQISNNIVMHPLHDLCQFVPICLRYSRYLQLVHLYKQSQQPIISKMGQEASPINKIHALSHTLSLVRQNNGEKLYINPVNSDQLLLVSRLVGENQHWLEDCLRKRKEMRSIYLPQLMEYGREKQSYCSDISVMLMLFKQPFKSLQQEMSNRMELEEWFLQGQVMMIAYCVLTALQLLREMDEHYEPEVNELTLFIDIHGSIVLSDTGRFREQTSRRSSLRRIIGEHGKSAEKGTMTQLGIVMEKIARNIGRNQNKKQQSKLSQFISALLKGYFQSYASALQFLSHLKQIERSQSMKTEIKRSFSKNLTSNIETENATPISQLNDLIHSERQPLMQIDFNQSNQQSKLKNICSLFPKKKQSKYHIYKSQFQARKTQAFAEENQNDKHLMDSPWLQESNTIRLDQMSSIAQQNTNRVTDQSEGSFDHQCDNNILNDSLKNTDLPLQTKIQLFTQSRPQRLKQLILNQKGIIYEQSADELQSLASQRTQRFRNISFLQ